MNPYAHKATGETGQSNSRLAWLIVALLVPVALLNYLDRQMLASMKFSVMRDLPGIGSSGTPEQNWGKVLAVFKWVYALGSPFGGWLADRFSRRHIIVGSLLVWSAVTWATGQVTTYEQLLATRALMGISEAFYIPAALALIADFHVGPTRSRAVGLHQMGIYTGVILGGFAGYAADHPSLGWRWTFDLCGLAGILYAAPLFYFLRNAPRQDAPQHASLQGAFGELLRNRSFILLLLCFTLPAMAAWVVRDWMPAILKKEFHLDQGRAGMLATLPWQTAAIFSAVLGGWLADRWMGRTPRGRTFVNAIGIGLIVPALVGIGFAPQTGVVEVAVISLVVFGIGWGFFDANNMPILCQITRPELRATGYGLMNFVSISCGGVADWGFGAMRDEHVSLLMIFGTAAAIAIVSVVLMLAIKPKAEPPPISP